MKNHLTKTYFTNQSSFIAKNGDDAWEWMCEKLPVDKPFTRAEVASVIETHMGYAQRTAQSIAYALTANCLAMPDGGFIRQGKRQLRFYGPEDE